MKRLPLTRKIPTQNNLWRTIKVQEFFRKGTNSVNDFNKRKIGSFYEKMAADYLISQGVMILERNYRNSYGEIDLIGLTPEGWVIFVEVKYRNTEHSGSPLSAVNPRKQHRISRWPLSISGITMEAWM